MKKIISFVLVMTTMLTVTLSAFSVTNEDISQTNTTEVVEMQKEPEKPTFFESCIAKIKQIFIFIFKGEDCTPPESGDSNNSQDSEVDSDTPPDSEENPPDGDIPENSTPDSNPDSENSKPNIPDTTPPEVIPPENSTPEIDKPDSEKPGDDSSVEPPIQKPDQNDALSKLANEVVTLVNKERTSRGLKALTVNVNVQAAATTRAKETKTSFSHTRPNGTSCFTALKEHNVNYRGAGENIAMGQRTAQQVMNGWMNSDGHRANILNSKFTQIGVGVYQDSNGRYYWTQMFIY